MNPATGEKLVEVPLSTEKEVDQAVQAAKKAQKEWALVPAPQRAEIMYEVGRLMKEKKEEISQLLTLENGKVLEEAREIGRASCRKRRKQMEGEERMKRKS